MHGITGNFEHVKKIPFDQGKLKYCSLVKVGGGGGIMEEGGRGGGGRRK